MSDRIGGMRKCAVYSCITNYKYLKKFGVKVRMFSFPKDKILRGEWLSRCKRSPDAPLQQYEGVCSRHFHLNDYEDVIQSSITNAKPKRLKPMAIPSRHLDKRPQNLLTSNCSEYHRILAEEILREEEEESSKSSDPIYLEFSDLKSVVHLQSESLNSSLETDVVQELECQNKMEPLRGHLSIALKKGITNKPYADSKENQPRRNEGISLLKVKNQEFIGNCYICYRNIKQSDLGQLPREEIMKAIEKALDGIQTTEPIVLTEKDGLCSVCRGLVTHISKLDAEMRTYSLSLRALLRLKPGGLPVPPPVPPLVLDKNDPPEKKKKKKPIMSKGNIGDASVTETKIDSATQTGIDSKRVLFRHKKTQTIKFLPEKISKSSLPTLKKILPKGYPDVPREITISADSDNLNCLLGDVGEHSYSMHQDIEIINEDILQADKLEEEYQLMKRSPAKARVNSQLLKCAKCTFKTKSLEEMKTHMLSFINKEGFYCSICDFAYHKLSRYEKHKKYHSQTSKNKLCIFCDAVIHDRLHMRFHIEAKHKPDSFNHRCNVCKHVFMFLRSLRRHKARTHKEKETMICDKCGKLFGDKIKYNNHMEYYHRDSLNCKYCQRQLATLKQLIVHERTKHKFDRTLTYQCSYCPKRFLREDLLPKHEKRHTGQFEHRCNDCGLGFYKAEALENHTKFCLKKEKRPRRGRPPGKKNLLTAYKQRPVNECLLKEDEEQSQLNEYLLIEYEGQSAVNEDLLMDCEGQSAVNEDLLMDCEGQSAVNEELLIEYEGQSPVNEEVLIEYEGQSLVNEDLLIEHEGQSPLNKDLLEEYKGESPEKKRLLSENKGQSPAKKRYESQKPSENLICDVCGKVLKQWGNFKTHRALHDDPAAAFQCHVCGNKFRWRENMRQHIKKFHPNNEIQTDMVFEI